MNINKEFACVRHKVVMPCNCYGRNLMALEKAADALAKYFRDNLPDHEKHNSSESPDTWTHDEHRCERCDQEKVIATYEKVRG